MTESVESLLTGLYTRAKDWSSTTCAAFFHNDMTCSVTKCQVLLFNFFHDSSVESSQWRVVLNAMDSEHRQEVPAPRFDENLHAGVCSEVSTRSRVHIVRWLTKTCSSNFCTSRSPEAGRTCGSSTLRIEASRCGCVDSHVNAI